MSNCYKKPFLNKVILRIDFTSKYDIRNAVSNEVETTILNLFPIPEPKEVLSKQLQVLASGIQEVSAKETHMFYHGKLREKTLCLSPDFIYLEVKTYESYDKLKSDFFVIVEKLLASKDFTIKRLGLRYINNISITDGNLFDWGKYLNSKLLNILEIPNEKRLISRAFSNLVQQFDDGMLLNFQYGMHNPDYPSRIRQKQFILDFDSTYQGLFRYDELKTNIDKAHDRIEDIFENSINDDLRELMLNGK